MKFRIFGNTDRGLVRNENEDNLLMADDCQVYAVADGLGGLPDGALASTTATQHLQELLNKNGASKPLPMPDLFADIHQTVCENYDGVDEIGMATTLTVAQIHDGQLHVAHMGDSGIFLFRIGECRQLTTDHTMAEEMMERMTAEEAENIPEYFHHTLTRCVGQAGDIEVDTLEEALEVGDRILLYTDGVTKTWEGKELLAAFNLANDPEELVGQIIKTANARGGPDNVTVIVIFVEK